MDGNVGIRARKGVAPLPIVNRNPSVTQKCSKCGREYPKTEEYFHVNRYAQKGFSTVASYCLDCGRAEERARQAAYKLAHANDKKESLAETEPKAEKPKKKRIRIRPPLTEEQKKIMREKHRQMYLANREKLLARSKAWAAQAREKAIREKEELRVLAQTDAEAALRYQEFCAKEEAEAEKKRVRQRKRYAAHREEVLQRIKEQRQQRNKEFADLVLLAKTSVEAAQRCAEIESQREYDRERQRQYRERNKRAAMRVVPAQAYDPAYVDELLAKHALRSEQRA